MQVVRIGTLIIPGTGWLRVTNHRERAINSEPDKRAGDRPLFSTRPVVLEIEAAHISARSKQILEDWIAEIAIHRRAADTKYCGCHRGGRGDMRPTK